MKTEEIERLNSLSEKAIKDIVTPDELEEFMRLLTIWNESTEKKSFQGSYISNN